MSESAGTLSEVLNATLKSIEKVIPIPFQRESTSLVENHIELQELATLVGVTGQIQGRLILQGPDLVFAAIGKTLYGMDLEGDMLHSMTGEVANQIAGNTATEMAEQDLQIEIAPPTVVAGTGTVSGFHSAIVVPLVFQNTGTLQLVLALENL